MAGKTVLVAGGAGAVGHFAIELAKRAGARVVTTVSGPEKAELARAAGADLVLNYREQDVAGQVRSFAGGPVDRMIEVALAANLETDLADQRPADRGRHVRGRAPGSGAAGARLHERERHAAVRSAVHGPGAAVDEAVAESPTRLRAGDLTPLPAHRFRLDDIAAAHEAVENGVTGKVFVVVGDSPDR